MKFDGVLPLQSDDLRRVDDLRPDLGEASAGLVQDRGHVPPSLGGHLDRFLDSVEVDQPGVHHLISSEMVAGASSKYFEVCPAFSHSRTASVSALTIFSVLRNRLGSSSALTL